MKAEEILKTLGSIVETVAPALGLALGGPVGGAAGAALALIAGKLGCDPAKPEDILQKLTTDPAALMKMKELELGNSLEIHKLALQQAQAQLADVQSARQREVEVVKATGKKDRNLYALAWLITLGFFSLTGAMYFAKIPTESIGPLNQLIGALVLAFGGIVGYFFGSSAGSAAKTQALVDMARSQ